MNTNDKFRKTNAEGLERKKTNRYNGNKKKINKKVEKTHMTIDFKDANLLQKFMINGYISFTKKKKFTKSTMTQVSLAIKRARYLGLVMY